MRVLVLSLFFLSTVAGAFETVLFDHYWFKVHYDHSARLARSVEYELHRENLLRSVAVRRNRFFPDPLIDLQRSLPVIPDEYKSTGLDRGHLAPAADFAFSQSANDQTFVMSNIAPQLPAFNSGSWLELEEQVRRWGCGERKLRIYTGPVLRKSDARIPSGLQIPREFFKLIVDETPPRRSRAFLLQQTDPRGTFRTRETTVKVIEETTGLSFSVPAEDSENWREEDCFRQGSANP